MGDVLYTGTPEKCRELMGQLKSGEVQSVESSVILMEPFTDITADRQAESKLLTEQDLP